MIHPSAVNEPKMLSGFGFSDTIFTMGIYGYKQCSFNRRGKKIHAVFLLYHVNVFLFYFIFM